MRRVFTKLEYIIVAAITAAIIFLASVVASAVPLTLQIISDQSLPHGEAASLALRVLGSSLTDLTLISAFYAGSLAIFIGINVSLLLFYFRMYRAAPSAASVASGTLGGIAAILGFGCAACGSLFLASFAATLGGTGILAALPYGGEEIGYIGMALLLLSAFLLIRAINKPVVCPI